jgi:serine/threonine-protein kinase
MYAMLTGYPPFAGEWARLVAAVLGRPPTDPQQLNPAVPTSLQMTCFKCLEKQPEQRYESLKALADDLERVCEARPAT